MSQTGSSQPTPLGPTDPRPAREVIDAAIQENRSWESLCYWLIIAFAIVGIGVIVYGAYLGNGLVVLAGSLAGSLFWPTLNYAVSIRRVNIAIRLLEVPLSEAKTAEQAAKAIKDAFISLFVKGKTDGVSKA